MSTKKKKQESKNPNPETIEMPEIIQGIQAKSHWYETLTKGYVPYVIFILFSLGLYANTFNHEYALDDEIVICKNEFVLRGLNGLPDIFSKDLFHSFYEQMNTTAQLSGGRYRPLSVASFALEQEFIGTREDAKFDPKTIWDFNENGKQDAEEDVNGDGIWNERDYEAKGFGFRHINNVIFYGLAICMLFLFLSKVVFKQNPLLAFIISLLFLAHPIHTEVVSNVKSRDEIFSFFFMILSLWNAHQFEKYKSSKYILFTGLSFFAAILSKEYGATLLILVPLSLYLFSEDKKLAIGNFVKIMVAMSISFITYLAIRAKNDLLSGKSEIQDTEILNNPFKFATDAEALATKFFIFMKYLGKLIVPHPLSSDYGYNSIPYKNFSMPSVWISILILVLIVASALISIKRRHWIAFAISFYMGTMLLVTNLIFNVGATMGERLAFHGSLGFCMILGFALYWLGEKINKPQLSIIIVLPILFIYSLKTFSRNKAWKNDISLALTDVEIMPESTSLNGNACSRNIDLSEWPANKPQEKMYLEKAIKYGQKSLQLHPEFVNGYMNLGVAYAKLDMLDSAKSAWIKAFTIYKHHPKKDLYFGLLAQAYSRKAYQLAEKKQWIEGREFLKKSLEVDSMNARTWYDFGGFSFQANDLQNAKQAWTKAYQLNPKDSDIIRVQGILR